MKRIWLIGIALLASGALLFAFTSSRTRTVHYHAGFTVYVQGVRQDFSGSEYMDARPCSLKDASHTTDNQLEKAHLHDAIGDVVHVHRSDATWNDLLKNIGFAVPQDLPVSGYVSGKPVDNILSRRIAPYDSVIIVFGIKPAIQPSDYVTAEHIRQVEGKSESCGS